MTYKLTELVAHRGDMTRFPENTLLAFRHALGHGACFIECDLQMNRQHDFIVIHDDNCLRTAGIDCRVFEQNTAALRKISAHEPRKFQRRFAPQYLCTLDDVLQLLQQHPKTQAFIEIKHESLNFWGIEEVMPPLLAKLEQHHERCILISFTFVAIQYAQDNSGIRTGWVLKQYDEKHYQQADTLQPDYLLCNYRKIPPAGKLWPGRWKWLLYDLTDPELANSYIKREASLIETGDISSMMQKMTEVRSCR